MIQLESLRKIRVGNTISVRWFLKTNEGRSLSDLNLTLYVIDPCGFEHEVTEWSIGQSEVGTEFVTFTIQGVYLNRPGVYSFTAYKDKGQVAQAVTDTRAFELVESATQAARRKHPCTLDDPRDLEIDTLDLSGMIEFIELASDFDVDTAWPDYASDTHVPSSKLVKDTIDTLPTVEMVDEKDGAVAQAAQAALDVAVTQLNDNINGVRQEFVQQVSRIDNTLAHKAFTSDVDYLRHQVSGIAQTVTEKADKTYVDSELAVKQDKLIAGVGISISPESVISASGVEVPIDTVWADSPSDARIPSSRLTKDTLDTKADKTEYVELEILGAGGTPVTIKALVNND